MRAKTFAELYCAAHALSAEEFAPVVLNRTLYPHARLFGWLVTLFHRRHFEADYDFVHDAGRLMRFRDFDLAVDEFLYHPGNRGFWRRVARVRVSSQRLRRLVRETLHTRAAEELSADDAETQVPFGSRQKPAERDGRATSGA
ncbi:MAG TPA: hypothetical protein VGD81_10055 [Opitutaceae bacterium]